MTKLLKCPFCGGEATTYKSKIGFGVMCKYTPFCCTMVGYKTKEEAIKAWNTRKPVDDLLERLEDMITFAENMPPVRDEYSAISYEKAESFIEAYKDAIEIVKEVMGYD